MATEVEILLKAIDHASAALNQVRGSSEKLGKGISGLEKNWNSMKSNVPGLSNVLALATNPITLVTAGVGAMAAVMKSGVKETVAYNKTIREMSQITGVLPEEISRIVQAADDWGISIDSVRTALQMANKNGYQPSIEMLANMADEYVNTADKQAFAAEAIKVFGKQYATLIPMLSQGGDALRANTAAINDNLVVTQKEIDASREYEISVDLLSDTWTGAKQNIGNTVIPVLNDLIEVLTGSYDATVHAKDGVDELDTSILVLQGTLKGIGQLGGFVGNSLQGLVKFMSGDYEGFMASFDAAAASISEVSEEVEYLDKGERDLTATIEVTSDATGDLADDTYDLAIASDKATRNINDERVALSDMEWVVSQPLTTANEDFIQQQQDIQTEMAGVKDEIQDALDQGYSPMGEKIGELQGKYDELSGKYDENATDHEAATARILFDFAVQKLGAEGLLTSGIYEKMAEAWGLTADAEIQAAIRADEAVNWLRDHPGDVDGMKAILEGQASSWGLTHAAAVSARDAAAAYRDTLAALRDRTIYVTTYYTEHRNPDVGGPHSSGADFIIPPGFDQDNYPLGFGQSGERVIVIPKNQAGNSIVNNNFNMSVHTNAGISTLMSDYNMMKAKVR